MFTRVAFLLLSINVILIESSKLHDVLKNVGKRFLLDDEHEWNDRDLITMDSRYLAWTTFSDKDVMKAKENTAQKVMDRLTEITSTENRHFQKSLDWLASTLDPKADAKVCGGEDKKMSSYEYLKYLTHIAPQYKKTSVRAYRFTIMKTERDTLRFTVNISHTDKFDLKTDIEYDITMDLTFGKTHKNRLFTISRIYQGGSCTEHGTVDHVKSIDDDSEQMKNSPTARTFLRLFTHPVYKAADSDPDKLPRYWLDSLSKDDAKINVCQEGVTEPVSYTVDQFRSWYKHFALMWHPKNADDNSMELQVIEMKDDSIVARVTMKLQMGPEKNATVHDWNFKFSAKQKTDETKEWYIDQLEVLCTPTVDLKDQSLISIRDVVAEVFVTTHSDLPSPSQWYSSVEFVRRFTKTGKVEFHYCDYDKTAEVEQIQLFQNDQSVKRNVKFLKYWVDHNDITLPAEDTASFRFKTLSVADTKDPEFEFEHEWTFSVKWDQMDQFYYIEKMEIGCEKQFLPGKHEEEVNYNMFIIRGKK